MFFFLTLGLKCCNLNRADVNARPPAPRVCAASSVKQKHERCGTERRSGMKPPTPTQSSVRNGRNGATFSRAFSRARSSLKRRRESERGGVGEKLVRSGGT